MWEPMRVYPIMMSQRNVDIAKQEHFRSTSGARPEHVRSTSGARPEHVRSTSGARQEHVSRYPGMSGLERIQTWRRTVYGGTNFSKLADLMSYGTSCAPGDDPCNPAACPSTPCTRTLDTATTGLSPSDT